MSTLTYAVRDSTTMLRRNLRHQLRYPSVTLLVVGLPVILLLLFVYVFGGTLGDGIGGASGGRAAYVTYVAPGMLLMAIAGTGQGTAIAVAMDMAEGIIGRFRTMAIWRPSVLTGHVIGAMIQTVAAMAVTLGVAMLLGFRADASVLEWLAAAGVLVLTALAVTWLTVAIGLFCKGVESASNLPMPLMMLPFLGSGFVPTDSMPTALRWFADYQPFTPVTETVRGLLLGGGIGYNGPLAVAWGVVLAVAAYLWARFLYDRAPQR